MNEIPNDVLIQIDAIVIEFEKQWRVGESVDYSNWLAKIPAPYREHLREELLATEAELRSRQRKVELYAAVDSFDNPAVQLPRSGDDSDTLAKDGMTGDCNNVSDPDKVLRRIDNYEILRELKSGGMGAVYVARHHQFRDRFYAIKLVKSRWISDEMLARFQHEIKVSGKLKHPNIGRVLIQ